MRPWTQNCQELLGHMLCGVQVWPWTCFWTPHQTWWFPCHLLSLRQRNDSHSPRLLSHQATGTPVCLAIGPSLPLQGFISPELERWSSQKVGIRLGGAAAMVAVALLWGLQGMAVPASRDTRQHPCLSAVCSPDRFSGEIWLPSFLPSLWTILLTNW